MATLRPIYGSGGAHHVSGPVQKHAASAKKSAGRLQEDIIGANPIFLTALRKLERMKGKSAPVLLLGESGTGKEVFARKVHAQECEPSRPFVAINCAAIPKDLVESVLFGHEKGAFTGASERRAGKFEQANFGDLFLDEIHSLPLEMQGKLLRVIENQEVERIGGNRLIALNVRVIAASNQPLLPLVKSGDFRADLYYRLRVVQIELPALRERDQDVCDLAKYFIRQHDSRFKLSDSAIKALSKHNWPGNVRELSNLMLTLSILADSLVISGDDIRQYLDEVRDIQKPSAGCMEYKAAMQEFEKDLLVQALKRNHFSRTKTCQDLGITRNMLYRRLHSLGVNLP